MAKSRTRKTVDNAPPAISRAALVRATALADQLLAWAADPDTHPDPLQRGEDPNG